MTRLSPAKTCTLSKIRDLRDDNLLSNLQNYLCQSYIVVAICCCFLLFYLRIELPDKSLSQKGT